MCLKELEGWANPTSRLLIVLSVRKACNRTLCVPRFFFFKLEQRRSNIRSRPAIMSDFNPIGSGKLILTPKLSSGCNGEIGSGRLPSAWSTLFRRLRPNLRLRLALG